MIKLKVGADRRRRHPALAVAREAVGPDVRIADRRQPDGGASAEAIEWMAALAPFDPYWIEEPTSPRRRARARRDSPGGAPDPGRHRRARRRTG